MDDGGVTVVLVHGLLRTPRSLGLLARALDRDGFTTRRFGYPSARGSIAEHARRLAAELAEIAAIPGCRELHLVGHSLGNLIARAALAAGAPAQLRRIVMLVPPNRGSPVARWLAPLLGGLVPVLRELSDAKGSSVHRLSELQNVRIGVIAARFDHLVPEGSTHLGGESDHVRVAATHSSVLWSPQVQKLVVAFLRTGRFPKSS